MVTLFTQAQGYFRRTIGIVTHYSPYIMINASTRTVAEGLSQELGQIEFSNQEVDTWMDDIKKATSRRIESCSYVNVCQTL